MNPQVKQAGFAGDLPSLKFQDDGRIVDESRCGDLWMRVRYTRPQAEERLPLGKEWQTLYERDMAAGGLSFYMDRLLARPGVDPSLESDAGLMTRGRALYTKGTNESGLTSEFGFGGVMRYVKGDQPGYTVELNGQRASDFLESTSRRVDYPSHWTSQYDGMADTDNAGLSVVEKRFITDYNVAVTLLEITNTGKEEKTVEVAVAVPAVCDRQESDGSFSGGIWVDHRNISIRLSLDDGRIDGRRLARTLTIPAGETVCQKAQMGFIDPKQEASGKEYESYAALSAEEAFQKHVQTYHAWWAENIPYMEAPDPLVQKMIAYRWWIARYNMADAGTYHYPFPTAMEGVLGYNNAIVNALPWQMDEMRYLRSPVPGYGTWADAIFAAAGGIYWDNPAGLWGVQPQHYISQAGFESYKVHGGQSEFLEAVARAGEGDVLETQQNFDPDGDGIYNIQYDAWDADTASLAMPGEQQRIDTAIALAYANAMAVSEMYAVVGRNEKAQTYRTFAEKIRDASVKNAWDTESRQFLMKMTESGEFNPFRDINNYYGFMTGMIPQDAGYDEALRVWGDQSQFPFWPMYISNSADYAEIQTHPELYTSRTRNYSPGAISLTLKLFGTVIQNYDAPQINGEAYGTLLKNYTRLCYVNENYNYPDTNEFFSGDPDNSPYRSWIHHNWHSQYNTLLIEDVMGMTPRMDKVVELNPIDVGWESFVVSNIRYHGSDLSIIWEKNTGYQLFVNGVQAAVVDRLCHFTWDAVTGQVQILDDSGAQVLCSKTVSELKAAGEVHYTEGRAAEIVQAVIDYEPGDEIVEKEPLPTDPPTEHDGSYKLEAPDGWDDAYNLDFGDNAGGDQTQRAQMFVAVNGGEMTGVQIMIQNKTAENDVTVSLYDTDANGLPGSLLAVGSIDASRVSAGSMKLLTVPLAYKLEKGKAYYIALGQADDGAGIYCWALSGKDMASHTQAVQPGYGDALRSVKIQKNGTRVDESDIGDYYLEVFYKTMDEPSADTTLEDAQNAVRTALDAITVTNDTAEEDIESAIEKALANKEVAFRLEIFEKTVATQDNAGTLRAVVALSWKGETVQVTAEWTISKLEPPQPVLNPGDLDKDGRVTIADVMEACKVLARKTGGLLPTADEIARGDLDGDGSITIADVMEICKILAVKKQKTGVV